MTANGSMKKSDANELTNFSNTSSITPYKVNNDTSPGAEVSNNTSENSMDTSVDNEINSNSNDKSDSRMSGEIDKYINNENDKTDSSNKMNIKVNTSVNSSTDNSTDSTPRGSSANANYNNHNANQYLDLHGILHRINSSSPLCISNHNLTNNHQGNNHNTNHKYSRNGPLTIQKSSNIQGKCVCYTVFCKLFLIYYISGTKGASKNSQNSSSSGSSSGGSYGGSNATSLLSLQLLPSTTSSSSGNTNVGAPVQASSKFYKTSTSSLPDPKINLSPYQQPLLSHQQLQYHNHHLSTLHSNGSNGKNH